ncbi:complement C1q tumor necrosis factor-related protein 3 [Perca flavescens]|uniref:complement C1q tumor necrosis factor-related protein 3 n=1 Tax=Perca flavescens TaxID=8167 RepID=UPI00106EAC43|nr:complement C1q tumor necrosis factor-related protein 3-like [Perca flavescens]
MKISVSFTLWLLLGTVPASESTESQPASPPDIYAALREITASLVQLKADMRLLQTQGTVMNCSMSKGTVSVVAEQAAQLKTEVDKQKTEVDELKQQQQVRQVAFSASLHAGAGKSNLGPLPTDTTLIYKHVLTNIGNAYNSNTGVFTAPVRGVYNFEWTVGANGDNSHASGAVLVKNSENVLLAYENQAAGFMSSSKGVTLLLEVGDVVFVRLWRDSVAYDNLNHHTTFRGHLLFPM